MVGKALVVAGGGGGLRRRRARETRQLHEFRSHRAVLQQGTASPHQAASSASAGRSGRAGRERPRRGVALPVEDVERGALLLLARRRVRQLARRRRLCRTAPIRSRSSSSAGVDAAKASAARGGASRPRAARRSGPSGPPRAPPRRRAAARRGRGRRAPPFVLESPRVVGRGERGAVARSSPCGHTRRLRSTGARSVMLVRDPCVFAVAHAHPDAVQAARDDGRAAGAGRHADLVAVVFGRHLQQAAPRADGRGRDEGPGLVVARSQCADQRPARREEVDGVRKMVTGPQWQAEVTTVAAQRREAVARELRGFVGVVICRTLRGVGGIVICRTLRGVGASASSAGRFRLRRGGEPMPSGATRRQNAGSRQLAAAKASSSIGRPLGRTAAWRRDAPWRRAPRGRAARRRGRRRRRRRRRRSTRTSRRPRRRRRSRPRGRRRPARRSRGPGARRRGRAARLRPRRGRRRRPRAASRRGAGPSPRRQNIANPKISQEGFICRRRPCPSIASSGALTPGTVQPLRS